MAAKILIIEDKFSALRFAQHALEQKGYEVVTASNGLEGLRKAQEEDIALLVLDIMLPGVDGFDLCHRLRATASKTKLPVLMLTAKPLASDRETGFKMGANEYLIKPVEPSELLASVERLLATEDVVYAGRAKAVAFVGSNREVGTSTVAVNVAVTMAQEDKSVILVDLCPYAGGVSSLLGLQPKHTIADLLGAQTANINSESLESLLTTHESGVKVLSSPKSQDEYDRISPSDVQAMLEELRNMAHYVLIDLPAQPSDITRAVLSNCDFATVVTSSALDSLGDMALAPAWFANRGINPERCGLVVIDKGQLFNKSGLTYVQANILKPAFHIEVLGIVPFDAEVCYGGEHQPIITLLAHPQCGMALSLAGVTERLLRTVS